MPETGAGALGSLISWLFWLLFLLMLLQPTLNFWKLKNARLNVLRVMERKYGFRIVTLIHRQERVGFFGIPVYRFIDVDDSEAVLRAIRATPPNTPIALIIHTPGGLVLAAAQIAMALKRHPAKKIVMVPHYAMSGGTLIALAADEIWMDRNAVLGPLDPQLAIDQTTHLPAPSIIKIARMKGDKASDKTLIMADIAEKAIAEMKEMILKLIGDKMPRDKAERLADMLTSGRWTHDYPITFEDAEKMGLPVKDSLPPEVYTLMELYPQAPTNRPGIDYIPYPIVPRPTQHGGNH